MSHVISGQVPSLTSTNNFINFCLTYPQFPNTNGSESLKESCNSAPMGAIPSIQNIPSLKIVSPKHGDTIQANTDLQLSFVVQNMQVGAPTDDEVNFLSAPQQLNERGVIIGYPIIIIEELPSLTAAQPGNARIFAFSKTVIDPPVNGISQDLIRMGLPPGVYRIAVQLRAVNRQPILVSTPEHGALGDMVYVRDISLSVRFLRTVYPSRLPQRASTTIAMPLVLAYLPLSAIASFQQQSTHKIALSLH